MNEGRERIGRLIPMLAFFATATFACRLVAGPAAVTPTELSPAAAEMGQVGSTAPPSSTNTLKTRTATLMPELPSPTATLHPP